MIRVDQRTVECGWGGGGNEPIYQSCMRRFQRKIRRTCWGATVLQPQTAEPSNCEGSTRYIRPTRSSGIVFRRVLTKARVREPASHVHCAGSSIKLRRILDHATDLQIPRTCRESRVSSVDPAHAKIAQVPTARTYAFLTKARVLGVRTFVS